MLNDGSTIGLALSGGGFRATLFGLGSLWRLNDAGLLGKLDRITSVSGGSILAGVLAQRWKKLEFTDGEATNFESEIAAPVREFCSHGIDVKAFLLGVINPFKSTADMLANAYHKALFGDTLMRDLPDANTGKGPKFIFYATNLQTGRSFRFRQDIIADYVLGTADVTDIPLAFAVAASSGFPPLFSPIVLKTDPARWKVEAGFPAIDEFRSRILLTDGGVYDNMGLESLVDNVKIVLVSDAGAPFAAQLRPHTCMFTQLARVRDILIDQTRALRKRRLIDEFITGQKRGGFWGIDTKIGDFPAIETLTGDTPGSEALARVATRLSGQPPERQGQLINWGYALCDAAIRSRANLPVQRASGLPMPQWSL